MSTLIDKIMKNSTIKSTELIEKSTVFQNLKPITTKIPMINVACSGSLDGGLHLGIHTIAGESKHFKSSFALVLASAFQQQYKDGIILFYDSEFGSPLEYFKSANIDLSRVVHTSIMNIEELKFDIMNQLDGFEKEDNVFILIDSIGNLASIKEVEDAMSEKSVSDMTRAKQLKSLWRMVTPHLNTKNIPLVNINHIYKEMALYPKSIVSGGSGGIYSSNSIWIVTRSQEKEKSTDKEISGYKFTINIEKSRYIKEKSKIPIVVNFKGGILKWSGFLEVALEGGYAHKPKQGYYEILDPSTGEILCDKPYKERDIINNSEIWTTLLEKTDFAEYVKEKYTLPKTNLIDEKYEETE